MTSNQRKPKQIDRIKLSFLSRDQAESEVSSCRLLPNRVSNSFSLFLDFFVGTSSCRCSLRRVQLCGVQS